MTGQAQSSTAAGPPSDPARPALIRDTFRIRRMPALLSTLWQSWKDTGSRRRTEVEVRLGLARIKMKPDADKILHLNASVTPVLPAR
jgi:hypothetical protein